VRELLDRVGVEGDEPVEARDDGVVIAPDASTLATLADAARQGALEERGAGPFAIHDAGTYVVRATAVGSTATSFRFQLWSVDPNTEHRGPEYACMSASDGDRPCSLVYRYMKAKYWP